MVGPPEPEEGSKGSNLENTGLELSWSREITGESSRDKHGGCPSTGTYSCRHRGQS
jgi:hypothetical protein